MFLHVTCSLHLAFVFALSQGATGGAQPAREADATIATNHPEEALVLLQRGLKKDPRWQDGWWRYGTLLYQSEDFVAARTAFERLTTLDAKLGAAWALLGLCEFEMKDYNPALQHLQRGQSLGIPSGLGLTEVVRYHEALSMLLLERYEPAQLLLNSLVRNDNENDGLILAVGMATLRISLLPAQLESRMDAQRVEILRKVGMAQSALARRQAAECRRIYGELVVKKPSLPNLHVAYASVLFQLGEIESAKSEYLAELKENPSSARARLGLCSIALTNEESLERPIALAREAVALEPKSFKPHYVLGRLLLKAEKPEEAVEELSISCNLEPASSRIRFALMQAYNRLNRKKEAQQEQQVFLRLKKIEDAFRDSGKLPIDLFDAN